MKKQLITAILACIQLVKESEYASVLQNKKMKKDTNVVVGYLTVLFEAFLKYQELISDSIIMFSVHTLSIALLQCDLS